jgi:hypothetical protein
MRPASMQVVLITCLNPILQTGWRDSRVANSSTRAALHGLDNLACLTVSDSLRHANPEVFLHLCVEISTECSLYVAAHE